MAGAVLAGLAGLAVTGCSPDGRSSSEPTPGSAPTTPAAPPPTAGPTSEAELSPGWDETPDGPSPTPDADLTVADLKALLRTRASSPGRSERCRADEVAAVLSGLDVAMGHRYTSLVLTNTATRACLVSGTPGLGARGDLGRRFTLTVEPGTPVSDALGPVRLAPGEKARSLVEWTGELAGHDAERASMLVVQLAAGQAPLRVAAHLADVPDAVADAVDIGMFTTVRVAPFERWR